VQIVVNAISLLSKLTGIGKYTLEICKRLAEEHDLDTAYFYGYYSSKLYMPNVLPSGTIAKQVKMFLAKNHLVKKLSREVLLLSSGFSRRVFDLYWEPNIVPLKNIRSRNQVTTVHDFSFHMHPEWQPKENRAYIEKYFWDNICRSDRIITVSEFIKKQIAEYLHIASDKIQVIHHGVDRNEFTLIDSMVLERYQEAHRIPKRFILFVGSIEPRKNLRNALLAYNSMPQSLKKEVKFVLAGFAGWNNDEIMKIINKERDNVTYLGYLTNSELAYLYNLAGVFIFPSFYEGFGLPPLEAMACGCPVVVSDAASLPEVCGDAACYVDPHSVESIAAGIRSVLDGDQYRKRLITSGLKNAGLFSWERSAKEHIRVFHEVMRS
jgi:glycosyltransferase involved in cell wall biosynthesis